MIKTIITSKINSVDFEQGNYILNIQNKEYEELLKFDMVSAATMWRFKDLPQWLQWKYDYGAQNDNLLKRTLLQSYIEVEIDFNDNNEFAGATVSIKHRGVL